MSATEIVALIAALGLGTALPEALRGAWKWATGRQGRERDALRQAATDLDAERAAVATARRETAYWMDAYYRLRAHAVARGLPLPTDLPTTIIQPPQRGPIDNP